MMARTVSVGRVAICRALIFHFIFSSLLVLLDRPATAKSNVRNSHAQAAARYEFYVSYVMEYAPNVAE